MSGQAEAPADLAQAEPRGADGDAALLALVARWRAFVAEMDALEEAPDGGLSAAAHDKRLVRLVEDRAAVERRIARMPARSLPGLRAKAEVAMRSADICGWGDVGPGDPAYVAYRLCHDLVAFAGGGAELRARLAARRAARRRWVRRCEAAEKAPPPPLVAERQRSEQEEAERLAALGWRGDAWTAGELRVAVWLLERLCIAGHAPAARGLLEAIGPDEAGWLMPAELKASLGLVTRH